MASPQQPAPPANPFDGFDTFGSVAAPTQQPSQQQQQQQQQQWAAHQPAQQQMSPQQQTMVAAANVNPFATATLPQQVANGSNANVHPFGAPQVGGGMMMAQPQPGFTNPNPSYPQQQQQPQLQLQQHAYQPQQPHQQQIVPVAPNGIVSSPWALNNQSITTAPAGGAQQQPSASSPAAGAQAHDPFGIFGASTQPQQQIQQPAYQGQQQQYNNYSLAQPVQTPPANQNLEKQNESMLPDEDEDEGLALIDVELDDNDEAKEEDLETRKNDGEFLQADSIKKKKKSSKSRNSSGSSGQHNSWDRNPDIAPPPPPTPGRNHAEYLAQNSAPAIASPLPRHELVHHSGYVLSRISFRTVLLRKWKQTFWIQYGPTQLLFFRTYADYVDWLNNPYHTIKAREFLVKLRVDFVSDLKKSSVMGYQVTQVRRKPYGKNVMLHFKLERWMDYGPTIAAAFAAREEEMMNSPTHRRTGTDEDGMNTTNDVASLRKIILGCMRNARDAALVASRSQQTDMGEAVGYRGRYDEEYQRESRIPSGSANIGYHQAFSAESSERRRMTPGAYETESSQDEGETTANTVDANASAPPIDLLG